MLTNPFNILYTDCPWTYKNKNTGGSMSSGSAAKYSVLSGDDLMGLRPLLDDVTSKDSILFFWITTPLKLYYGPSIIKAWGYTYRTTYYWHKEGTNGLGYWFRGEVEECWICSRGSIKAIRCQLPNHLSVKPTTHSHKPEEMYATIETATESIKNRRRLELFATKQMENWTALGFEIDGNDIRAALRDLANPLIQRKPRRLL